ncbi:hypothetical protein BAUCODRAFT_118910 [Baudoinia panamericana UAMH 10762]|uniref:Uncharacterized protein n=1 Tax=Baudoinia panamericana (strain UAMH 10762) TaxID=717646 RepID=M2M274_BAUPA|nr:uncharacterized protein BAUCODRAFT_118910 [Baudoinia panamericana UAMH 10762]EMD01198.1 hypothetical protein BAUCODRAFT_118910 [Baudoinia panamericana UAMH 10762]
MEGLTKTRQPPPTTGCDRRADTSSDSRRLTPKRRDADGIRTLRDRPSLRISSLGGASRCQSKASTTDAAVKVFLQSRPLGRCS